ncbi:MAG TPA: 30S ribosomal protein S5 [Clostridiales bacterium]|jgi:small subunit ribosomal protein S5|nr:30S ribosomal protein S5 [Clostridiales bacterium]
MVSKRIDPSTLDLVEKNVVVKSVSKTVKGGRIRRWSAIMVVGDGNGHVGYGLGKAAEVPEAIRKAIEDARKNIIKVSLKGTTIPHEIIGEYGAGRVLLKPAPEGTGIIAGATVRALVESVGIKDIRTKCLRSSNPTNVVKATFEALRSLRTAEEVAKIRDIPVEQVRG